jgi:CRISPR-associated protein Cmr6
VTGVILLNRPLPRLTSMVIERVQATGTHHPGLALDKHAPAFIDMGKQRHALLPVCNAQGDPALLAAVRARRSDQLRAACAVERTMTTAGPLTLHLSRATGFENAGFALHPLYGFAFLPGSGLKGLARAYATTVWKPAAADADAADSLIRSVFGFAADDKNDGGMAGAVVFHDAWPATWPKVSLDVAAIHHPDYYQASDARVPPPADWESPSPVTFLAIGAGVPFDFAVAPRLPNAPLDLVGQAMEWLVGGLVNLGAGAKTNAGYGRFMPAEGTTALGIGADTYRLVLATPAFLAGAAQEATDCDLRGATLRGQLRWWWRTLHSAHLSPSDLRSLETAIWGSSSVGSAVSLSLEPVVTNKKAELFDRETVLRQIGVRTARGFIPGLSYVTYGMDENSNRANSGRIRRHYRVPGSTWTLRIAVRASKSRYPIAADEVRRQVRAAMWLFLRFGGVGSKARKGFGAFWDVPGDGIGSLEDCRKAGGDLRTGLGLPKGSCGPNVPSLDTAIVVEDLRIGETDAWKVIHAVGEMYQAYVKSVARENKQEKAAFGLPRTKFDPRLPPPPSGPKKLDRHPTPVLFHPAGSDKARSLRLIAFPIPALSPRSQAILTGLEQAFRRDFAPGGGGGGGAPGAGREPPAGARAPQPQPPRTRPGGPEVYRAGRRGTVDGEPAVVISDGGGATISVDIGGDIESVPRRDFIAD